MTEDRNPAGIVVTVVAACAVTYAGILLWLWPRDLEQEAQRQWAADASVAAKAASAPPPAKPPERSQRPRSESVTPMPGVAASVATPATAVPNVVVVPPAAYGVQSVPQPPQPQPQQPQPPSQQATAPPEGRSAFPPPPPGYTGPVDPFADDPYAPQPPVAADQ